MKNYQKRTMSDRMDYLFRVISSEDFLNLKGETKETSNYICPFDPKEAETFAKETRRLKERLHTNGIEVCMIDLYDLSKTILEEEGAWDSIIEDETDWDKEELKDMLKGMLDPKEVLAPRIEAEAAKTEHQVIFITGSGAVFPYVRTHNLIESLGSHNAKNEPIIIFFPGDYIDTHATGLSLELFNMFPNDRYYRAHNIYNYME